MWDENTYRAGHFVPHGAALVLTGSGYSSGGSIPGLTRPIVGAVLVTLVARRVMVPRLSSDS